MPFRKDAFVRQRAHLLLDSHWRPDAVAKDARCSRATAYRWERNPALYGDTVVPRTICTRGRGRKLSPAAKEALLEYQRQKPWLYMDELARFLKEEWDIRVCNATVCNALKRARVSHKKGQRISDNLSEELRIA